MIIEVDKYKEIIAGYDPAHSDDVHIESAKMADKDFEKLIKEKKFKEIIFMSGGTASGKSEFAIQNYRESEDILVLDATLKNIEGFKIKYKLIQKYQKEASVKIIHVAPIFWPDALDAFYGRERKMKIENFWITHIDSKKTIISILREYKEVVLDLILSSYSGKVISFKKFDINNCSDEIVISIIENLIIEIEESFSIYKNNKDMI